MAGTLSPDQGTYRDAVAAQTGLDVALVTAWIGCESGWGVTKPGHNYLNIGPGRSYPDVQSAARDVTTTLHNGLYADVLAAVGGPAQLAALKASPWDAGHYAGGCLDQVYAEGGGAVLAGFIPSPGDVVDAISGTVGGVIGDALDLDDVIGQVLVVVVSGVFVAAAFGLIILGVNRLTTNSSMRQRIESTAQTGAQLAAVAAL